MADSPMYRAFVEVVPEGSGFTGALTKQVSAGSATAGAAGGKAAGTGFIGGFGRMVPVIGAALAALGIGDLIGDSITDASNLQQARGAVEDVYGELGAKAIASFAEGAAKSIGQSKTDVFASASILGLIGKNAGLAGDDLTGFSSNLITLGSDLAAFAGGSPEDAVQAIMSGFRGEADPLEKYGVFLNDAALRQKALEMGIYDGNGALDSQQRTLAAYQLIMDSTGAQQGKFAEESDTLAGKQAIVAAGWENISARIGESFLPIAEKIVGVIIDDVLPAVEDFADWFAAPETQQSISEFASFLKDFVLDPLLGAAGVVKGFADLLNGEISFTVFSEKLRALPGHFGEVYNAAYDIGARIGSVIGGVIFAIRNFVDETGRNIAIAIGFFQDLPRRVGLAVQGAGSWLVQTGRDIINGLVRGIEGARDRVFGAIGGVVTGAIDWAKDLLGIQSPSKVFAQIGEYTAEGFAKGIEAKHMVVRASTQGMVAAAADGASASTGPGFANYGNVYTSDPWGVAAEFEKQRRREMAVAF